MDTPSGTVVGFAAEGARAVVDVKAAEACARCAAGRGCGAGILQGTGKVRRIEVVIEDGLVLHEGDTVHLELAGSSVLKASVIVYGLPLLGAAVGAALAYVVGLGDAGAAALAIAGLAVGFFAGRIRLRRHDCLAAFTPVAVGRIATHG